VRAVHDIAEVDAPFAPLKPNEIVPVAAPASEDELMLPVPADAPPMPQTHFTLGQPSARWSYRDDTGRVLLEVLRFDKSDGGKEFWPLTLWRDAQGLRWRWKSVPPPRPLYNLDKLAGRPDAPVIICEGEKAADAAAVIFRKSVAATAPGGANAADKADWSVLRGRKVLVWPDDDAPGLTYAGKVGAMLAALDCDISMIDAYALARIAPGGGMREPSEKGWDAANAIAEWPDLAALRLAAVNCAKPFRAPDYISFGDFEMSDAGLHREATRGRGDKRQNRQRAHICIVRGFRARARSGRASLGPVLALARSRRTNAPEIRGGRGPASRACSPVLGTRGRRAGNSTGATTRVRQLSVPSATGWPCNGGGAHRLAHDRGRDGVRSAGRMHWPETRWPGVARRRGAWAIRDEGHAERMARGRRHLAAGHAIPMLAISTALAGPLLHLAGLEGGGLNLGNPAEAKPHACKQPRAFGDAAAHRASSELGAQPATVWRALPRNPAIP
jgi:putative DNA primase/helicase